jgi:hypothetical protein
MPSVETSILILDNVGIATLVEIACLVILKLLRKAVLLIEKLIIERTLSFIS